MLKGITGVHHVSITVPDLESAMEFYCDVLGFRKVMGISIPDDVERASLDDMGGKSAEDAMADVKRTVQVAQDEELVASLVMLQLGNSFIELFEFKSPASPVISEWAPPNLCGIRHIALDVIDLEGLYPQLMAAGVTFHAPPQHNKHVITTYGRDPWGNIIEFQELKPHSDVPAV